MKKGRILWIVAIAAVLLLAGYLTITTRAKTDAAVAPPPAEVEVATVQQQDLPIEREWVGTLDGTGCFPAPARHNTLHQPDGWLT